MDLENLQRAGEIRQELEKLNEAFGYLQEDGCIRISKGYLSDSENVVLRERAFKKGVERLIEEHIAVLLEEAKTL